MTSPATRYGSDSDHSEGSATRRLGYLIAVAVNAALLFVVNEWPGWQAVPFLTPDAEQVVPIVNASLVVGGMLNLIYLARDPTWLRAIGDAITTAIALAVLIRMLQVFPFDFSGSSFNWDFWVRFTLWFLTIATGIALIVQTVGAIRALTVDRLR